MSIYLTLKTVHILSAMIVLGTGVGIAWFCLRGWLSGDDTVRKWISEEVVVADWIFTGLGGLCLLASAGGMLAINPGWLAQSWVQLATTLTAVVFLLWAIVVWLQYQLRATASGQHEADPTARVVATSAPLKAWCILGAIAFPLMLMILYLMVAKPTF